MRPFLAALAVSGTLPVAALANTLVLDLVRDDRVVIAMEDGGDGFGYALSLDGARIDRYDAATGRFELPPT